MGGGGGEIKRRINKVARSWNAPKGTISPFFSGSRNAHFHFLPDRQNFITILMILDLFYSLVATIETGLNFLIFARS